MVDYPLDKVRLVVKQSTPETRADVQQAKEAYSMEQSKKTLEKVREVMGRCKRDAENPDLPLDVRTEHRAVYEALLEALDG